MVVTTDVVTVVMVTVSFVDSDDNDVDDDYFDSKNGTDEDEICQSNKRTHLTASFPGQPG